MVAVDRRRKVGNAHPAAPSLALCDFQKNWSGLARRHHFLLLPFDLLRPSRPRHRVMEGALQMRHRNSSPSCSTAAALSFFEVRHDLGRQRFRASSPRLATDSSSPFLFDSVFRRCFHERLIPDIRTAGHQRSRLGADVPSPRSADSRLGDTGEIRSVHIRRSGDEPPDSSASLPASATISSRLVSRWHGRLHVVVGPADDV